MTQKLTYLFFILLFAGSTIFGQTAGISFMLGSPQGEFRENVDRLGYGIQAQGTLWAPNKVLPFTVGLNASYMIYGEESDSRPLSNTIPDVWVDVDRTNNIANFHLLFQVSPFWGDVRPYMEGLVGGSYLFTKTSVSSEYDNDEYDPVFESTNFDDWAWSYGFGGGLMILLARELDGDVGSLFLDLKARYLFGTEAQYLREGDVEINPHSGTATYYYSESETDLLSFHLGVVLTF
ncbi:MAG: hypothetical protein V1720_05200 [bacterium]